MPKSYNEFIGEVFASHHAKRIEVRQPIPGLRHNTETIYVHHRFPVKGGISAVEHLNRIAMMENPILKHLRDKGAIQVAKGS